MAQSCIRPFSATLKVKSIASVAYIKIQELADGGALEHIVSVLV